MRLRDETKLSLPADADRIVEIAEGSATYDHDQGVEAVKSLFREQFHANVDVVIKMESHAEDDVVCVVSQAVEENDPIHPLPPLAELLHRTLQTAQELALLLSAELTPVAVGGKKKCSLEIREILDSLDTALRQSTIANQKLQYQQ